MMGSLNMISEKSSLIIVFSLIPSLKLITEKKIIQHLRSQNLLKRFFWIHMKISRDKTRLPTYQIIGYRFEIKLACFSFQSQGQEKKRNRDNAYETKVTRGDIYYGFSLPFSHKDIFTFKPIPGLMVVGYDNSLERAKGMYRNERDSRSKALAQTGFDTRLNFQDTLIIRMSFQV